MQMFVYITCGFLLRRKRKRVIPLLGFALRSLEVSFEILFLESDGLESGARPYVFPFFLPGFSASGTGLSFGEAPVLRYFAQKENPASRQPDEGGVAFLWKTEKNFGVLHENRKNGLKTSKIK